MTATRGVILCSIAFNVPAIANIARPAASRTWMAGVGIARTSRCRKKTSTAAVTGMAGITPVAQGGGGKSAEQDIPDEASSQGRAESQDHDADEVEISIDCGHGAFH